MKPIKMSLSLCLLFMLFQAFSMKAYADPLPMEPVDVGTETKITLQYTYDDVKLHDMTVNMYRVGEMTKSGSFIINEPYKSVYQSSDSWELAAENMAAKAKTDHLEPKRTGTTDQNGVVVFESKTGDKLSTGLYLVTTEKLVYSDKEKYTTTPFLVSLPTFMGEKHNGVDSVWNYKNVTASPKVSREGEMIYKV